MSDPRDLAAYVRLAVAVERSGLDGVMVGEHVAMGPNSSFRGPPLNPRDWLMAGNQDSRYPHPASLLVLSAMAAVTTRVRLIAGAVITPLRHPIGLAKDLATLDLISRGRLIIIPGVSWQEEEYAALNVPFHERGSILDEQLDIWQRLWEGGSPVSSGGKHFAFDDIYVEPAPYRAKGPEMWIGGKATSPWALRRVARYGTGFFPIFPPSADELNELTERLATVGRRLEDLDLGAFVFGKPFTDASSTLDLDAALAGVPDLLERGINNLVIKPSQFIDDPDLLEEFCREFRAKVEALARG